MNLNFRIKQIFSMWPILLLLLMMPALVLAQQDDKDKDKKKNPPPPPKKSDKSNPPKKTPPPQNGTPPKDAPPKDAPKSGVVPPAGNPPNGGQPNNNQPNRGNQPNNNGQPNNGQPRGGQPNNNNGQPNRFQPNGPSQQVHLHDGNATVVRGTNSHVTTIHTSAGVTINHTDYGRRVVAVRPGGVTVVTIGNRGFVQRPLARVGFVQRTYVVGGRSYVRVYRNYTWHGIVYQRYVPAYYYGPGFYVWAGNPWARPVYWGWGWGRAPWFYGGYFAPAPFYVSASLWLTDYIIAENLRASYEAQQEAIGAQYSAPPPDNSPADPNAYNSAQVSPAVRQAIADEVQRQLDAEKNAAANVGNPQQGASVATDSAPPALSADARVFVVSAPLQVTDGNQPCSLTAGDIVSRVEDSPGSDGAVAVSVLNSKPSDCRSGAQPRVQVTDLQDMANDLRAQTDDGLKNLSQKQGTNGMPPAPDAKAVPNPNGQGTPDPDAVNQLKQQQQDADQTEKEVGTGQSGPGGPGGNEVKLLPNSIFPTTLPFEHRDALVNLVPAIDTRPDLFLAGLHLTPDLTSSSPESHPDLATLIFGPRGRVIYLGQTF
ncbi:MAG TPA: hypothetical protein VIH72_09500 [Candidatus Acidoferrales bacterium]